MSIKPILFSTPMVKAILNGSKTQTRRPIKSHKNTHGGEEIRDNIIINWDANGNELETKCQFGKPGDVLWVRETWQKRSERAINELGSEKYYHKAGWEYCTEAGWRPSIFMPFEACRIFLRVKGISVERLHAISEEDAKAEGVLIHKDGRKYLNYHDDKHRTTQFIYNLLDAVSSFKTLWEVINGKASWKANPWVWVIEFERITNQNEIAKIHETWIERRKK